jgi:hypothetical protein
MGHALYVSPDRQLVPMGATLVVGPGEVCTPEWPLTATTDTVV